MTEPPKPSRMQRARVGQLLLRSRLASEIELHIQEDRNPDISTQILLALAECAATALSSSEFPAADFAWFVESVRDHPQLKGKL